MPAPPPPDLWVVKDSETNGAGGVWFVSPENYKSFLDPSLDPTLDPSMTLACSSPSARYVVQKYSYPPMLLSGRKCHMRVYCLLATSSSGCAVPFISKHAFLHVSNSAFSSDPSSLSDQSVHISNCCANSQDPDRFMGEILVDLEKEWGEQTWGVIKQAIRW